MGWEGGGCRWLRQARTSTASWQRGFRSVWRSLRGCATRGGFRDRPPAPARGALGFRSGGWQGLIRPIRRPPRCSRTFGFPFSFPPTAIHGILDSGRGQNGRLEFWVVAVRLPTGCCWVIASTTICRCRSPRRSIATRGHARCFGWTRQQFPTVGYVYENRWFWIRPTLTVEIPVKSQLSMARNKGGF